jgi:hypothetical protein
VLLQELEQQGRTKRSKRRQNSLSYLSNSPKGVTPAGRQQEAPLIFPLDSEVEEASYRRIVIPVISPADADEGAYTRLFTQLQEQKCPLIPE